MNSAEEELQNEFERSGKSGSEIDMHSYKIVFDALKKEPDFNLSYNFADKVIAKIEVKKEDSKDSFWIVMGVLSFVIAAIISIVLTDFKLNFGAFRFLSGYAGLFAFGIVFILVLHWIDKKLIRPLHTS
ncbi:MAG: hypothetical protein HOP08_10370 [Cyclobacteriaceae bacterium]|nr:hypothetical protein [Cyclobacteriaceae bacterium]